MFLGFEFVPRLVPIAPQATKCKKLIKQNPWMGRFIVAHQRPVFCLFKDSHRVDAARISIGFCHLVLHGEPLLYFCQSLELINQVLSLNFIVFWSIEIILGSTIRTSISKDP